jgi:hypothetical protein
MKTKYLCLVCLILFTVSLISCQKESSFELPDVSVPSVVNSLDSNYLSKVYAIDTSGLINDTTYTISYLYDNVRRHVKEIYHYSNVIPGDPDSSIVIYRYNGSDTVPYRTSGYEYIQSSVYIEESYHFYNSSGQKIKDSTASSSTSSSFIYNVHSYATNKIIGSSVLVNISSTEFFRDSAILDATGNIIRLTEYSGYSLGNMEPFFKLTAVLDNKPNPLAKLSSFKAHQLFPAGNFAGEFIEFYPQKNNFLSSSYDLYDGLTGTYNFFELNQNQLTYNSNGFVKTSRRLDAPEKKFYLYTSL